MTKVVYAWEGNPYIIPDVAKLYMGVPRYKNGNGFKRLEQGDDPLPCRFCHGQPVSDYPHYHKPLEVLGK